MRYHADYLVSFDIKYSVVSRQSYEFTFVFREINTSPPLDEVIQLEILVLIEKFLFKNRKERLLSQAFVGHFGFFVLSCLKDRHL